METLLAVVLVLAGIGALSSNRRTRGGEHPDLTYMLIELWIVTGLVAVLIYAFGFLF